MSVTVQFVVDVEIEDDEVDPDDVDLGWKARGKFYRDRQYPIISKHTQTTDCSVPYRHTLNSGGQLER